MYDVTLDDLKEGLIELGEYNELGMYEVLGSDQYYFPIYDSLEFPVNEKLAEEVIGYFIVYLKDGTALLPFIGNDMNKHREQLVLDAFRFADEEDYGMLFESRKWLLRSIEAIEKTIKEKKLGILLHQNIKEEDLFD